MPEYRLYKLDARNRIISAEGLVEHDDAAAIEAAHARLDADWLELWCGARMVARLEPNPPGKNRPRG